MILGLILCPDNRFDLSKRILLTGVSSFTGCWFAKILHERGYEVVCPLPREKIFYDDLKKERLEFLPSGIDVLFDCPFGSDLFIDLLDREFDLLCLHGSYVHDYGKNTFLFSEAISQNLRRVEEVLRKALASAAKGVVWTSSVFENAVDLSERNSRPPPWYRYALSKKVSGISLQHLCWENGMEFGRFVISNPFGPLQDRKLGHHLAQSFLEQKSFELKTPHYVRDMIHVRHLASAYHRMVDSFFTPCPTTSLDPCEYVSSLLDFSKTFYGEFSQRLGYSCEVGFCDMDFIEPRSLANKTEVCNLIEDYDPDSCWDELLRYYE